MKSKNAVHTTQGARLVLCSILDFFNAKHVHHSHTSFSEKRVSHIGVSLPNESKDSVASTQEKHFDNLSKQSVLLAAWTLEAEAKRETGSKKRSNKRDQVRACFVGPSCGVSFRVSRTLGCFRIRVNDPEHVITMPFQNQIFFPGFPVDVAFID